MDAGRQTAPRDMHAAAPGADGAANHASNHSMTAGTGIEFPYNDPHLAWLVQTYLYTPEGAAVMAERNRHYGTPSWDQPPAALPQQDSARPDVVAEPDQSGVAVATHYREKLLNPPGKRRTGRGRPLFLIVALLICVVLTSGITGVLMMQEDSQAVAKFPPPAPVLAPYAVKVECPFMKSATTMTVIATSEQEALQASERQLSKCTVSRGDFDVKSLRR